MIDGLKVTLRGEELRALLDDRAVEYRETAARWRHESDRTAEDSTETDPVLPEHMCRNEAAQYEWRADVAAALRERVDASEIYMLGIDDLEYVGFLPAEPEMFGPYDLEDPDDLDDPADRADPAGDEDLGPHAKRVCMSPEIIMVTNPDVAES